MTEPIDWAERLGPIQKRPFTETVRLLLDAAEADRDRLLALDLPSDLDGLSREILRRSPQATEAIESGEFVVDVYPGDVPLMLRAMLLLIESDPNGRLAEAWDKGHEAGSGDEAFYLRGLASDADAGEHPHANPYRKAS